MSLASEILETAVQRRASEIILGPNRSRHPLHFRIDGVLHPGRWLCEPELQQVIRSFERQTEFNTVIRQRSGLAPWQSHDGRELELRINVLTTLLGRKVTIGIRDPRASLLTLDGLGLSEVQHHAIDRLIHLRGGLILMAGPARSGITTLHYAILKELDGPDIFWFTLEDPVKLEIDGGAHQVHINPRAGMTFATMLRIFIRKDPDVVMVSDIRDRDTVEICLKAAATEHLVLAGLLGKDEGAVSVLDRFRQLAPEPASLAALSGVIVQRLVRRICLACREPYQAEPSLLKTIGIAPDAAVYHGAGCEKCAGSGYSGQAGLFEILTLDSECAAMLADGVSTDRIGRQALACHLLLPFSSDAREKITAGITTADEIRRVLLFSR